MRRLIDSARANGFDEKKLAGQIIDEVGEFDDAIYYTWGPDQTQEVLAEIRRRLDPAG